MREKEKLVAGLDFERTSVAIEIEVEAGSSGGKQRRGEKEREREREESLRRIETLNASQSTVRSHSRISSAVALLFPRLSSLAAFPFLISFCPRFSFASYLLTRRRRIRFARGSESLAFHAFPPSCQISWFPRDYVGVARKSFHYHLVSFLSGKSNAVSQRTHLANRPRYRDSFHSFFPSLLDSSLSLSLSLFLSSSREEIRRRFNLLDTIHIYEARQTINNLAPCLRASQSDDRSFVLLIDTFN